MDINLTDLRYFLVTAENKNISKAATELGIRQPSLSLAIKRLEENLDCILFIRSKKGVSLTREGKLLFQKAQEVLNLWEETVSEVTNIKFDLSGTIRFGCHPSVGLYSLKYFLPKFLTKNPKIHFSIENDLSRNILDRIVNSELDIGLVINPSEHPDIIKTKILTDEVCLWGTTSSMKNIESKKLALICDPSLTQSMEIIKKIAKTKFKFEKTIHTGNLENIVNLVQSGVGIGIIPTKVVKESGKKLIRIDSLPMFRDELYLVYRYENKGLKLLSELVKSIKENLH